MAGFEVIIYGRFWVIAEEDGRVGRINRECISHIKLLSAQSPAGQNCSLDWRTPLRSHTKRATRRLIEGFVDRKVSWTRRTWHFGES
jgi:hypothetical protein